MTQQAPIGSAAHTSHPAELYLGRKRATVLASLADITNERVREYEELGFLAIGNAFTPGEVEAAKAGIADLVAGRYPAFTSIEFEARAKERIASLPPEERLDHVRKLMNFTSTEPRLAAIANHPTLLAAVRRLIGAEPKIMQEMALLKPPLGREKPWHQDNAYFDLALGTPVIGVWIALDDVDRDNGCMHLLPGGHRQGPLPHFQRRDWQLCDTVMLGKPCVAVPLHAGGCLLFNGMLPHGTPENTTGKRRRALQFHYVPQEAQKVEREVRKAAFGGDGRNVSC